MVTRQRRCWRRFKKTLSGRMSSISWRRRRKQKLSRCMSCKYTNGSQAVKSTNKNAASMHNMCNVSKSVEKLNEKGENSRYIYMPCTSCGNDAAFSLRFIDKQSFSMNRLHKILPQAANIVESVYDCSEKVWLAGTRYHNIWTNFGSIQHPKYAYVYDIVYNIT